MAHYEKWTILRVERASMKRENPTETATSSTDFKEQPMVENLMNVRGKLDRIQEGLGKLDTQTMTYERRSAKQT